MTDPLLPQWLSAGSADHTCFFFLLTPLPSG